MRKRISKGKKIQKAQNEEEGGGKSMGN